MPRNTVVYKLGAERNLEVATHNFPAQIKTHLRHAQHARQNCEWASFALHLSKAVALFAELGDNQKTVLHCNTLLDALALSRGAELSVREVPKCRVKGEAGARYMADALLHLGNAHLGLHEYDEAIRVFDQLGKYEGKFMREVENTQIGIDCQFQIAVALLQRGEQKEEDGDRTCTTDYEDALKRFYGLLSRHDSAKSDQSKKCDILLNLGIASGCLRKLSAAQNFLERSLKIAKELGDEDTVARVYFNLSNLFQKANELPRALEFLQRELLVHKKANNIDGCMETYWEIALLQQKMQKYEDAISTLNHYIGAAKKLSDNSAQDRAHDLLRALEENIQHKMKISQLSAQLDTARRNKAPPRAQFKLLWEIADLRMLLSQHEPALQAFTALQNFSRGIPLNATETDAITKGLGDANAALGRFDAAIVQYRSLLSRWTGLTAERAEVLWKLSDCIARGNASIDAITSPLIECDRIGIHLRNRAIQYQAQSRLADVYTHFKYLDKAQRARARAVELECIIEADGVGSNDYDDEEDDNVIGERGDVCDDDDIAITGKEKTEEASRRGRTIGKSDGRRTSGIVEKLDFTLESSPERRIAEEKKRRSAPRKIIPVQSHLYNTQGILSLDKRETILLSSSPTHSDGEGCDGYMLTNERAKIKRKLALEGLKKRRRDGTESPEPHPNSFVSRRQNTVYSPTRHPSPSAPPSALSSRVQSMFDIDFELPDLPPPVYEVGNYRRESEVSAIRPARNHSVSPRALANSQNRTQDDFEFDSLDVEAAIRAEEALADPNRLLDSPTLIPASVQPSPKRPRSSLLESNENVPVEVVEPGIPSTPTNQALTKKMKIRVQVGTDMLQIPCSTVGTPKTVRWLQNEVARRYKQMHKKSIQVEKLMVQDDRNSREKTLFKDDLVIHVLEGRENVKAIFS